MRKIISLGLLAATILVFSTPVLAGHPECEEDKVLLQSLDLYGLCNAYWNNEGNEELQLAILQKFEDRAAGTGVSMPGLADFACPCWTEVSLQNICYLGEPFIYQADPFFNVIYGYLDISQIPPVLVQDEFFSSNIDVATVRPSCIYDGVYNLGPVSLNDLTLDEMFNCQAEIETIGTLVSDTDYCD